uniref:Uncharacterized protein n=1 Tax=Arundo donax TaxID=35708 RepID=A0A0A8Y7S6_ARUDO
MFVVLFLAVCGLVLRYLPAAHDRVRFTDVQQVPSRCHC